MPRRRCVPADADDHLASLWGYEKATWGLESPWPWQAVSDPFFRSATADIALFPAKIHEVGSYEMRCRFLDFVRTDGAMPAAVDKTAVIAAVHFFAAKIVALFATADRAVKQVCAEPTALVLLSAAGTILKLQSGGAGLRNVRADPDGTAALERCCNALHVGQLPPLLWKHIKCIIQTIPSYDGAAQRDE